MTREDLIGMTKEEEKEDMIMIDSVEKEIINKVYGLSEFTDEDLKDAETGYKSVQKFPEKGIIGKIYGDKLADEDSVNEQMINSLDLLIDLLE